MRSSVVRTLVVSGAAAALACSDQSPTGPDSGDNASARNGPALEAAVTATGFRELRTEFDWSIDKRVAEIHYGEQMLLWPSVSEYHLKSGETIWISYEIDVGRTERPARSVVGVRGTACIANRGTRAIDGVSVTGTVQASNGGAFADVATFPVGEGPLSLAKGETECLPYEVEFAPVAGATHRVAISASSAGGQGATASSGFTVPATETPTVVDDRAVIDDGMRADSVAKWWERGPCANRWPLFHCTSPGDPGLWPRSNPGTITFMVDYYNRMSCGETHRLTNVATLTESGYPGRPPQVRVDSATILITTDPCPPADDGCTLTQGYWGQSHHPWPGRNEFERNLFRNWPFFDSGLSWQQVFDSATRGDAYLILAHQYMAATLNLGNGADAPQQVRDIRQAAAEFFSLLPEQRAAFDRATLIEWAELLTRFNEGNFGVPSCD